MRRNKKIRKKLYLLKCSHLSGPRYMKDSQISMLLLDSLILTMIKSLALMNLLKVLNILELNCLMKTSGKFIDIWILMGMGILATASFASFVKRNGEILILFKLLQKMQKRLRKSKLKNQQFHQKQVSMQLFRLKVKL
jgi:hypothetical protein